MSYDSYRVSVEVLENGFKVEVPDLEARAKKEAEAKKKAKGDCCPSPYYGDCTKSFAAKSVKEVMKIVQGSLEKMPDVEFDSAFDDAASKKD